MSKFPKLFLVLLLMGAGVCGDSRAMADDDFFETHIRPLLVNHCLECHQGEAAEAGLRLDSLAAMLTGNDQGPVLSPGQPDRSRLLQVVATGGEPHMPPGEQLADAEIELLRQWIISGAAWPQDAAPLDPLAKSAQHWAFQPLAEPAGGMPSGIDHWVELARQRAGLATAEEADSRQLVQRLFFDLVGLPPTWEEWQVINEQPFQSAWPKLVDELLARPQFGERWARHWLDVSRYADTKGYVFEDDRRYKTAYLYRDWVIRAFNDDLPYNEFLNRQIAVDCDPAVTDRSEWAALGFWTLGRRFLNNPHDILDDRVDVLTRGTLGLTVACARCHDHKYDPISMADYYSLTGILAAASESQVALSAATPEYLSELQRRRDELTAYEQGEAKQGRINELRRRISEWENSDQAPLQLLVLQDPPQPPEWPHILLRGNPDRLGPQVPRQFVRFLSAADAPAFEHGSGRRELAAAITNPANPLTARVWVNRVWSHLWGQGLVSTPSDFGLRSEPPLHPELLDELAREFMADGWSTKRLIRRIVLSAAYRQSSAATPETREADPENQQLARFVRRRLDWESMRDRLLAAAGVLDGTLYGPSSDIEQEPFSHRRTVYAFVDRQNLPGLFRTFDLASPDAHSPRRFTTTVPQQALYLMNHPFVIDMARRTADRAEAAVGSQAETRDWVDWLYRQLYLRTPTEQETALALSFLDRETSSDELIEGQPPREVVQETTDQDRRVQYVQALLISNEFQFID